MRNQHNHVFIKEKESQGEKRYIKLTKLADLSYRKLDLRCDCNHRETHIVDYMPIKEKREKMKCLETVKGKA